MKRRSLLQAMSALVVAGVAMPLAPFRMRRRDPLIAKRLWQESVEQFEQNADFFELNEGATYPHPDDTLPYSEIEGCRMGMFRARLLTSLAVLAILPSCAVHRDASGSFTGDLGRDAGIVLSKSAQGDLYVVLDQNESKSFGRAAATIISKFAFDFGEVAAAEKTARETAALDAQVARDGIAAQSQLDILSETNRGAEALAEIAAGTSP